MLKTQRLGFRELTIHDIALVHELLTMPETDQYNTLGIPENIHVTEEILTSWLSAQKQEPRISYVYCLTKNYDHSFVGLIALNLGKFKYKTAEVWFKTHKDQWRQGYTSEALAQIVDFGFNTLNLHRIEAGCAVENIGSVKTLEKVGFTKEGMKRKKLPIRGDWKDNYFFGILEEDFNIKD